MAAPLMTMFRLTTRDGPGLACDEKGVALGPVALVDALSSNGKCVYRARPAEEIARALALAYDPFSADDLARRLSGLDVAARALEAGDLAKAGIATVLLKLSPLSAEAFAKLAQEPTLKKYSPDQPRDERGRWTTDGSDAGSHGTAFAGGREGSHTSVSVKPTMLADSRSGATVTDATTNGTNGTNDQAQSVAAVPPDLGSDATQVAETTSDGLKAQHEVARTAIASIWRESQVEKREYFGFIYRDQEGNYHATRAVPGVFMWVPQRTTDALRQEIPEGATVTAYYHTHFNSPLATLREKENFSPGDIVAARDHQWDAYMGTGLSGHLQHYSFDENAVSDLGRLYPNQ